MTINNDSFEVTYMELLSDTKPTYQKPIFIQRAYMLKRLAEIV